MLARNPACAAGAGRVGALVLAGTSASPVRHRGLPMARGLVAAARPLLMRGAALSARLPGPTLPADDLAFLLARMSFGKDAAPAEVSFVGELTAGVAARVSVPLLLEIIRFDEEESPRVDPAIDDCDRRRPGSVDAGRPQSGPGRRDPTFAVARRLAGCGHMVMMERRREMSDVLLAGVEAGLQGGAGTTKAAATDATALRGRGRRKTWR